MKPDWKYNTKFYGKEAQEQAEKDPLFAKAIEDAKNMEIMNAVMPYFTKVKEK